MIVDDEPITARGYARALTSAGYNVTIAAAGREGATLAREQALRRDRQRHRDARHGRAGAVARHPPERPRRADDLHDRQPGAGDGAGGDRVRRVPLPAQAGAAGFAAGGGQARGRRAQAGAGPARGERWSRSWRGSRSAIAPGLEARFASAVEKLWVAAQPIVSWSGRSTFAYETLLRTDEPTLRSPLDFFDAAERLGKAAELGRIIRRHVAALLGGAARRARVRQPAPRRSRGPGAVRRRRRADAVRRARSSWRSPSAPRSTAFTSSARA